MTRNFLLGQWYGLMMNMHRAIRGFLLPGVILFFLVKQPPGIKAPRRSGDRAILMGYLIWVGGAQSLC
jgi:hypothetical protein